METAYIDLNLESEWQHPDNSGWLNVFNHWAWSGMFRVTWAVSAATYGARFRAFCERRLNLQLGDVLVKQVVPSDSGARSLAGSGLNPHEEDQLNELGALDDDTMTVYRLELHVTHPIAKEGEDPLMQFGFGYAVVKGSQLFMYRVQDHLRGMGLGRSGLVALVKKRSEDLIEKRSEELAKGRDAAPVDKRDAALGVGLLTVESLLTKLDKLGEHTDRAKLADFRAMVVSVNEEWIDT
jgi:hypothetical protein